MLRQDCDIMKKIAIIGTGLSGAATFINLIERFKKIDIQSNLEVFLIDKRSVDGKGFAYDTEQDCHVLNTLASGSSILKETPNDFIDWLNENHFNKENYYQHPPRNIYGQYISYRLNQYIDLALKFDINVKKIVDDTLNITFDS